MKKILTAAIAFTLLSGTAALAQPYNGNGHGNDRNYGRDNHAQRPQAQRWSRGQRLPSNYRASRYAVDYRKHHLKAPPRGYRWQQVDNNYVLAAVATGLIAQVIAGR